MAAAPIKRTFFDLPAELRNYIYSLALVQSTPIELPYAYEKQAFVEPPLLSASRLIRTEAAAVFYGSNIFAAPSPPSAHRFLQRLSPTHIRQLRFFRPGDLARPRPDSAHRRWYEALRANINRLVLAEGKGALSPAAIYVPLRRSEESDQLAWCRLSDVEHFQVVRIGRDWSLGWREEA